MIGDAAQHVGQPGLWIDIVELGGDDQAVDRCGPRKRRVGPSRFLGRSAKAMPLSVSTVWI